MPYTDQGLPHAGSAEVMYNGLFDEPAGSLACTVRRVAVQNSGIALGGTGIPMARILPLPAGMLVTNLAWHSGSTAEVAGTHWWLALMDVNSNVLGVTADQTGATFVTATTFLKEPVTNPFVIPQTGPYYAVVCVSATTTMPTSSGGANLASGLNNMAPTVAGSLASQPTPPAVGANLGAITGVGFNAAFWVS